MSYEDTESGRARLNAALLAGSAVGATTLLLTVARVNERDLTFRLSPITTFVQAVGVYLLPSLVLLFVIVALAAAGLLRRWHLAAAAGLAGGLIGGIVGYVQRILSGGLPLNGEAWQAVLLEFFGGHFAFLAYATLSSAVLVPILMRRGQRDDRAAGPLGPNPADPRRFARAEEKLALVRVPSPASEEAELSFIEREPVDAELMNEQWEAYATALEEHGWATREVAAAPTMADSVFTEDQAVVLGDVAVLGRSGAASRRGELAGVRAALLEEGFVLEEIEAPGTLDGGDVLVVGDTVYVGSSSRTNASGIRQLRRIAGSLGYRVTAVPVDGALHLKTIATALPDGTVLAWLQALPEPGLFERVLGVPEPLGASVLPLDGETVLVSEAAPRTAELVERLGYRVVRLDISEFEKLEGGVTCLSLRAVN